MVLAHRERLSPKPTQADLAKRRLRDYADHGKHVGALPPPGVYARHNAVDTPALLPDGSPAQASVSRVLAARGTIRSAPDMAGAIRKLTGFVGDGTRPSQNGAHNGGRDEAESGPLGPIEGDPSQIDQNGGSKQ
jgi:NADH-quinone oxidoreductase subunit J